MKLLYITNGVNGSGGLERVLSIKASYLVDKLGYEVTILGLNKGCSNLFYEFSNQIKFEEIEVSGNPFSYIKKYISGIKDTIKKLNPDVVIVCDDGLKAFSLPTILGKAKPIIYERHVSKNIEIGKDFNVFKLIIAKTKMKIMEVLGSTFTKFIVLTKENTKEWNLKNLQIISNPLSFYPNESATLQNKKVIAVGKQSYQKGYDRLLVSWQTVIAKNPNWKLEIYGKKDSTQGLENLAKELNIASSVTFFEPEKNILPKYLDSSIYVMSSRFEGFGMVLIEAMACGIPCVSFDCPFGPSDIIQNDVDGFLVDNNNTDELTNRLNQLIEDENLRLKMGANAKENVKRFLPETIMSQWDNLFKTYKN
ncbi:glycosyltransferase family 4 protein [Flavobacterium sp.]|uniref:glycosyltransferase family 4 protein n=1 Tax=Flavobacterium sp. TaxID=239 RepID=UPI00260B997B|nr:glycosyltransferase family 4 protein [Flavobacterium sp.]